MATEKIKKVKRELDAIIGANIRAERKVRSLSRDEFAGLIDMTIGHIGLIERGKRGATAVTLVRLSKALDKSIDSFFYEPDEYISDKKADDTSLEAKQKRVLALLSLLSDKEVEHISDVIKGLIRLNHLDDTPQIDDGQ